MKIGILGTGYVGLVTGACFAQKGHYVVCMDVDAEKIQRLERCELPIYEPGLQTIIETEMARGYLQFTEETAQAVCGMDICMIAVGTPADAVTNQADLRYVLSAARAIGQCWQGDTQLVIKSTVPVGSHREVRKVVLEELDQRGLRMKVPLSFNPEFLREGSAIEDCLHPERVILGVEDSVSAEQLRKLYADFVSEERILIMDIESAEMTKYASNSMLATKISFINEIANICERIGADVRQVSRGMGLDARIGPQFLRPGCGYGGSCFPKDICALIALSKEYGYEPRLLQAVEEVNQEQKRLILKKIMEYFGELSGRTIAVWGLAFKPDTDDMRCAPAIEVVYGMTQYGAQVRVYDPQAVKNAQMIYLKNCRNVTYFSDPYKVLAGCDALVVLTEWDEFIKADPRKIKTMLKGSVIFDGRNIFDPVEMQELGFSYHPVGVGNREGVKL